MDCAVKVKAHESSHGGKCPSESLKCSVPGHFTPRSKWTISSKGARNAISVDYT